MNRREFVAAAALSLSTFPSSAEEGLLRGQQKGAKPPCSAQTGWCWSTTDYFLTSTILEAARYRACAPRPSARAGVAAQYFFDVASFLYASPCRARASRPPRLRSGIEYV